MRTGISVLVAQDLLKNQQGKESQAPAGILDVMSPGLLLARLRI